MAELLNRLKRLRRLEAEQAKRDLAAAVTAETAARRALTQAQAAVAKEAHAAVAALPGAFAAWLPAAAEGIAQRHEAEMAAGTAREAARHGLAERQAALKAVEMVLEARAAQDRLDARRRDERSVAAAFRGKTLLF